MMKESKSNGGMISFGRVVLISLTEKKKKKKDWLTYKCCLTYLKCKNWI